MQAWRPSVGGNLQEVRKRRGRRSMHEDTDESE